MNAEFTQLVAAGLKTFFDEKAHSDQFGAGLIDEVQNTFGSVAVG